MSFKALKMLDSVYTGQTALLKVYLKLDQYHMNSLCQYGSPILQNIVQEIHNLLKLYIYNLLECN